MALINSLTSGVSALRAFSKGLEVIGDNIANVTTTGFKTSRADYKDSFSDVLQRSSPSPASGVGSNTIALQVGSGVRLEDVKAKFTQGALQSTGLGTDLGIAGNGFFRIKDSLSGVDYVTRAGNFRIDDKGFFTTSDGSRVQGLFDGSAQFTASVDANGKLTFAKTSATAPSTVGDLKIESTLTVTGGGLVNNTGGAFTDAEIEAAAPRIQSFNIDRGGNVNLFMSNGETYTRGQVLIQQFQDTNALVREGGNRYSGFEAAGPIGGVTLSAANAPQSNGLGSLESGTLELSNVDLTEEFSNLITTQRAFQAGSRIITVSDQVLEDVVNLKR